MNKVNTLNSQDIMAFAGVIAAVVGVIKTFKLFDDRFLPMVSCAIAAVFVLSPATVQNTITSILVLGLSAAGVYQYNKKKDGGTGG